MYLKQCWILFKNTFTPCTSHGFLLLFILDAIYTILEHWLSQHFQMMFPFSFHTSSKLEIILCTRQPWSSIYFIVICTIPPFMDELLCSYEWRQVVHTSGDGWPQGEASSSPPQVSKFLWREEHNTAACRGGWATTDNIEIKQAGKHLPQTWVIWVAALLHEGKQ